MRACFLRLWLGPALVTFHYVTDSSDCAAVKLNFNTLSTTRENKYKLQKSASRYNLRKFSFCSRVVNIWNSLPDSVVDADTLNTFKSRLDKHWLDQDVLYNFYSELTGTGGASVCM